MLTPLFCGSGVVDSHVVTWVLPDCRLGSAMDTHNVVQGTEESITIGRYSPYSGCVLSGEPIIKLCVVLAGQSMALSQSLFFPEHRLWERNEISMGPTQHLCVCFLIVRIVRVFHAVQSVPQMENPDRLKDHSLPSHSEHNSFSDYRYRQSCLRMTCSCR